MPPINHTKYSRVTVSERSYSQLLESLLRYCWAYLQKALEEQTLTYNRHLSSSWKCTKIECLSSFTVVSLHQYLLSICHEISMHSYEILANFITCYSRFVEYSTLILDEYLEIFDSTALNIHSTYAISKQKWKLVNTKLLSAFSV